MPDMDRSVAALKAAKSIVFLLVLVFQRSGIPTFRDKLTELWSTHDPEKLATAKAFRENTALVRGFYLWRRNQMNQAKPNAAHVAIQRLATSGRSVAVITQNIDDLHECAGSVDVAHLHRSFKTPECFACRRTADCSRISSIFFSMPPSATHLDALEAIADCAQASHGLVRTFPTSFGSLRSTTGGADPRSSSCPSC